MLLADSEMDLGGGGGPNNIKMSPYQYSDPHVKDKTVLQPWEHGNPHTWERRSLYWDEAKIFDLSC